MNTDHVHPLLSSKLDRRNVPPEFIDLILDVGEYMVRSQMRANLIDQPSRYSETTIVGNDMQWDMELI